MASVASHLIEEVTAHPQSDSLEDARELCADGTYFPNNHTPDLRPEAGCTFSTVTMNVGDSEQTIPLSPHTVSYCVLDMEFDTKHKSTGFGWKEPVVTLQLFCMYKLIL